jgi:hypothetical protein
MKRTLTLATATPDGTAYRITRRDGRALMRPFTI